MADIKIDSKPSPLGPPDDPDRPGLEDEEASFNDDQIVARRAAEQARARLAQQEMRSKERSKDILAVGKSVTRAERFHGAGSEEDPERRARMLKRRARDEAIAAGTSQAPTNVWAEEESLGRMEQRLVQVWAALLSLEDLAGVPGLPIARQHRLEVQAKHQLQLLLSGGVGLSMFGDWRLTFKRLFARLGRRWPRLVRPGRTPDSDEDFDAFLAWVYEPPPPLAEEPWT